MQATPALRALVLGSILTAGCASQTVRVPPRVDLRQHEMIGVIEFDATPRGELGTLATRRFTEMARRDQGLLRIVDCGPRAAVLLSTGGERLEATTFRALGRERDVRTILTGELTVSNVRPDLRIARSVRSGSLSARVDATLAVQLVEAATGASIWSSSASATHTVGHVSVLGGKDVIFDARDPEQAYGGLVDDLVEQVTRDFRYRWERR